MPTSLNTIEYVFTGDNASVAGGTARSTLLNAVTIHVPETTGRVFKAATLLVMVRDTVTAAASMTSWSVTATLNAVSSGALTTTNTPTNTGEQQSFMLSWNLLDLFVDNFGAGTSQTLTVSMTIGGLATRVTGIKLILTYEFDTSNTTRIKTVRLPIQSTTDRLTNVLALIDNLPDIDAICPEASKVYRCTGFEFWTNEAANATTDHSLEVQIDAEAATVLSTSEQALNSSCLLWLTWRRDDIDETVTHTLNARWTGAAAYSTFGGYLTVTYEYDHSTTTSVMNSLIIPVGDLPAFVGATTTANRDEIERSILIMDPATVTLAQSAVWLTCNGQSDYTLNIVVGDGSTFQTGVTYQVRAGGLTCGGQSIVHRIDSGGSPGSYGTFARGENDFHLRLFANNDAGISNVSAVLILNYTSGIASSEASTNTKSIFWQMYPYSATVNGAMGGQVGGHDTPATISFQIPETNWWMNALSFFIHFNMSSGNGGMAMQAEYMGSEGPFGGGVGWAEILTSVVSTDAERGESLAFARARSNYKRHPNDPDTSRMDIETARLYKVDLSSTGLCTYYGWVTYHSHTWTISGTVSGYTGDGSGITVQIRRADNDDLVYSATTSAGGGYTATVYDNVVSYYATARQDDTHVGRSGNGTAS